MILKSRKKAIGGPEDMAKILQAILKTESKIDQDKEHAWAIGLTTRNNIKYIELVSLGILNSNILHPRETYRLAIQKGVDSILIAHNHPSGDPRPSDADINQTGSLQKAGEIVGIQLVDHIIITNDSFYSMKEKKDL